MSLETFDEAIRLAASFGIGCIEVMDGVTFGYHEKCPVYTLQRARENANKGNPAGTTAICGNVGHTQESAEAAIGASHADFISIGRPYMSNPDLPERFRDGVALAEPPAYVDWWTTPGNDGYNTFPRATKN